MDGSPAVSAKVGQLCMAWMTFLMMLLGGVCCGLRRVGEFLSTDIACLNPKMKNVVMSKIRALMKLASG